MEKKLSIAILGYRSTLVAPWDPDTIKEGLPGSEECAVYSSLELARLGHNVTVYMNVPSDSAWRNTNPKWLRVDDWLDPSNKETYDLVLMWRRFDVATARHRGKTVFFWPHDAPPHVSAKTMYPPFPDFDGVCLLSDHQKSQYSVWPRFEDVPYTIAGNGLMVEQFDEGIEIPKPHSIGYFSNYARGLLGLILIWPNIKEAFPDATLDICYGRETWGTLNESSMKLLVSKIEEYETMGVTEHGKIGHVDLANIMKKTSILAYPCNTLGLTETFCITLAKCQAAGCIPVITRIGALNEIGHPDCPRTEPIVQPNDLIVYRDKLLETMHRVGETRAEDLEAEREKYRRWGKQYSWERCVSRWLELYHTINKKC